MEWIAKKLIGMMRLLAVLFIFLITPSFLRAELTKKDLEEIRAIVKEEISHVEKRLDLLERSVDKRLEQFDKRLEQLDKRFEQIDKRFEQIDKRLGFIENLMIGMLGVFGGLCGVFVGLLLWDRRTFKDKAKEEAMRELEQKWRISEWINALKGLAEEDERLKEILKKWHLL